MSRTSEGQPKLALRVWGAGAGHGAPSGGGRDAGEGSPIVVTMGDPAGVGPEIVLRALASLDRSVRPPLTVIGARGVFDWWARRLGLEAPASMIDTGDEGIACEPGRPTAEGARAALRAIEEAARLCLAGEAGAMVTAPVSKSEISRTGLAFPGHTEYLAELTGASGFVMTFVSGGRRVGLVTTHVPISEVPRILSTDLIIEKLALMSRGLTEWFGIGRPKIAVAALNPHAGEGGQIGDEDNSIVRPAVEAARRLGLNAHGPFPADTIYLGLGEPRGSGAGSGYDAVLAMYHDQATIPVKLWGLQAGVNVTLGLPIVRTSVDHGTAYDIAGRGVADPGSLEAAIDLAAAIVARRAGRAGGPSHGE